jgi:hypothetical protein
MKWLVITLAVVAGLYGLLELAAARRARQQPLFPGFKPEAAEKISLHSPRTDVVLERQGDVWLVASEGSFPADFSAVGQMLDAASAFSRKDMVSSNPERQALYQVDTTGVAVSIEGAGGRRLASFIVGKLGPDYQSTYVRDASSNTVILAAGHLGGTFDRGQRSWQDKRIFAVEPKDVIGVTVTKPGLSMALERRGENEWVVSRPESGGCDPTKVSKWVRALANLRADDFVGRMPMPAAGLENPDSSVSLETAAGAQVKLLIGHALEGGRFYVKRADRDIVYTVSATTVKNLLQGQASLAPAAGAPASKGTP